MKLASVSPLLNVTLLASDRQSYEAFVRHSASLDKWLCADEHIIEVNDVIKFEDIEDNKPLDSAAVKTCPDSVRIVLAEPASRGYAVHAKTRFYIALAESKSLPKTINNLSASQEMRGADDLLLIDENFLGSTLLAGTSNTTQESKQSTSLRSTNSTGPFSLVTLRKPPTSSQRLKMCEEDHTIFVNTDTLGKIGVFDDDWVRYMSGRAITCMLTKYDIPRF